MSDSVGSAAVERVGDAALRSPPTLGAPSALRALVIGDRAESRYRAGRTLRALRALDIEVENLTDVPPAEVAASLTSSAAPVWFVRAGAWPAARHPISPPPPSATGAPLCALGAITGDVEVGGVDEETRCWDELLDATGGCLQNGKPLAANRLPLASVYLEAAVVASLAARIACGEDLWEAIAAELTAPRRRVVRLQAFDVRFDPHLRVAQVVTSLQLGGAERVALDLHRTLPEQGVRSCLITLGSPTREAFDVPLGVVDVSRRPNRIEAARHAALAFAADLVHGHLLHADDVRELAKSQLPVLLTIHNMQPGWPTGLATLTRDDAALLVACSQAVEASLAAAQLPVLTRTVWNGIDFASLKPTPGLLERGAKLRRDWGFGSDDFVLLALANPRPQKRLERLPAIVDAVQAELSRRGIDRVVRLVIAGEASRFGTGAQEAEAVLAAAIAACDSKERIHRFGAVKDLPPLLAACDALVSASAYEGLSLAHLEALAAGLAVVATDVGGTAEIAHRNEAVKLVALEAAPRDYAAILVDIAASRPSGGREQAAQHFTCARMTTGYRRLYPRAIEAAAKPKSRGGLLLVANNFSTGGAQSSARRLLVGLAEQGVRARAVVLQEQPEFPTPGRSALVAAGVPVLALPAAGTLDPADAVQLLLAAIDRDRPDAVVFWNALASYKVLLADQLVDLPIFDVSPGEMLFHSLDKYFEQPRPGLPYRTTLAYGRRLAGVVVKYSGEAELARRTLGAPVHVVPNGVVLGPYEYGRPRPARDRVVIGTAARLSPQKKLEDLFAGLRAAIGALGEKMPCFTLKIAGGPESGELEYAKKLRRENADLPIEWLGEVADMASFHRELDLFAMISEPAGCPNASLEAMGAGLPIVATDVGGAAEQIVDGATGRIVPRGDAEALAAALIELAIDANLRRTYGDAARRRAASHFDQSRMIAAYRRIFLPATPLP